MAIMTDPDRVAVRAKISKILSSARESISVDKLELKAAIDALDQYLSDNEVTINNILPLPARTNLTKQQKALLMAYVTLKRYEVDV